MKWLQIPGLKLKSVSNLDDMYVDEEGKHIIFRQVQGKTVPIRTDSEGYASWLEQQGVEIDPADQKTLRQLEKQLDVFDRAREAGGAELQQEHQKAFEKELKQQQKIVKDYYQKALEKQAEKQQTTPDKVHEAKKQTYEKNKDKLVNRTELDDRGWGSYIQGLTDTWIKNANVDGTDKLYHVLRAADLIMMKAIDLAKQGVEPSKVSMYNLIKDELEGGMPTFGDLYGSRYKPMAEHEGFNPTMFLGNMHFGVQNLEENFEKGTAGIKQIEETFDAVYRKVHDDFHPEKEEEFQGLPEGLTLGSGIEKLPDELPETMNAKEASALKNFYSKSKGSPLNGSHKVALHSMARLFESIPDDDRVRVAIELSDQQKGLHAVHKAAYRDAFRMSEGFGMDLSMDDALDAILRETVKAGSGTTTDKINAMKKIAQTLGTLDGLFLVKRDNKGYQSHTLRWSQASINAGRARGEGPDLVNQVIDENNRKANIYSNKVLKVPHNKGDVKKPQKPDLSSLPEVKQPPQKEPTKKGEVYPGFILREGRVFSEDGYSVRVEGKTWNIHSPEGEVVGTVNVTPGDRKDLEKAKERAFSAVQETINRHKKSQADSVNDQATQRAVQEFPAFDFKEALSDSEKAVVSAIDPDKFEISTITPGTTYRVKQGDKFLDLIHAKGKLLIGSKDAKTGGMHVEDATPEAIQKHFAAEETEPEKPDEPTPTPESQQPEKKEEEESAPLPKEKPYEAGEENLVKYYYKEDKLKNLIDVVGEDKVGWKHFRDDSYQVTLSQDSYNKEIAHSEEQAAQKEKAKKKTKKSVTNWVHNFK